MCFYAMRTVNQKIKIFLKKEIVKGAGSTNLHSSPAVNLVHQIPLTYGYRILAFPNS